MEDEGAVQGNGARDVVAHVNPRTSGPQGPQARVGFLADIGVGRGVDLEGEGLPVPWIMGIHGEAGNLQVICGDSDVKVCSATGLEAAVAREGRGYLARPCARRDRQEKRYGKEDMSFLGRTLSS